jgi:hypothetical protein
MKTREQIGNKTTAAEKFLKVIARKNKWIEDKEYEILLATCTLDTNLSHFTYIIAT